jgi:hypothetical protein
MTLEGFFMFQRFVQCTVEAVLGGHSIIGSHHHVHGRRRVPGVGERPVHSLERLIDLPLRVQ